VLCADLNAGEFGLAVPGLILICTWSPELETVATVLTGEVPEHVVNPAVLESDALRMRARAARL